jgi:hypothetical protein
VARIPLAPDALPEQEFNRLVDEIWMKTTSPLHFTAVGRAGDGQGS